MRLSTRRALVLFLLSLVCQQGNRTQGQDSIVAERVESLRERARWVASARVRADEVIWQTRAGVRQDGENVTHYDSLFDFRTRSCRLAWTTTNVSDDSFVAECEFMVTPTQYLHISDHSLSGSVSSKLLPSQDDWYTAIADFPVFALFDYVPVGRRGTALHALLSRTKDIETSLDRIDEATCAVISGMFDEGELSVWFDQEHDGVVRRIVFNRTAADSDDGMDSYQYDALSLQEIDGRFMPLEFRTAQGYPPTSGRTETKTINARQVRIQINPRPRLEMVRDYVVNDIEFNVACSEADFEHQMTISNGTTVFMVDAPNVRHEWRDGEFFALPD